MSGTTQAQIDEMKALAEKLEQDPMVKEAWVDDWGRYGNFNLILRPTVWDRTATNRLKGLVSRSLKQSEAHLRNVFPPERIQNNFLGERQYHCNFWKFEVDFHTYIPEINDFAD